MRQFLVVLCLLVAVALLPACGGMPSLSIPFFGDDEKPQEEGKPVEKLEPMEPGERAGYQPPPESPPEAESAATAEPQTRTVRRPPARPQRPAPAPVAPREERPRETGRDRRAGDFECPPPDGRPAKAHRVAGINALGVGDLATGERELRTALCLDPDDAIAASLLEQITSPVRAFFGRESFEYRVQPGDSLSRIAKKFLDDPFLFYVLARYNGIDNPSRLEAGQVIEIPSSGRIRAESAPPEPPAPPPPPARSAAAPPREAPDRPVAEASEPAPDTTPPEVKASPRGGEYAAAQMVMLDARDVQDPAPAIYFTLDGSTPTPAEARYEGPLLIESDVTLRFRAVDAAGNPSPVVREEYRFPTVERHAEIKERMEQGQVADALQALEGVLDEDPLDQEARQLYVRAAARQAEALSAEGRLLDAQSVLQNALAVDRDQPALEAQLAAVEAKIAVGSLYETGVGALGRGEPEAARQSFLQVLELDPSHPGAAAKLAEAEQELVEVYSKAALAAFRRQDLDASIAQWDRVLELDPDNEMAQLRRAQAVDLKERFEQKFESSSGSE